MKKVKKMKPRKAWAVVENGKAVTTGGSYRRIRIYKRKSDAEVFTLPPSESRRVARVEIREI